MRRALTISVPEEMYSFIRERTRQGMHGSVSDYLRSLVRRDRSAAGLTRTGAAKGELRRANDYITDAAAAADRTD